VQITPAIAPEVAAMDVYQRTPVWCLPKPDVELAPWFQRALGVPGVAAGLHGVGLAALEAATWLLSTAPLRLGQPAAAAAVAGAIIVAGGYNTAMFTLTGIAVLALLVLAITIIQLGDPTPASPTAPAPGAGG
jgi:hypothetical protein